jgi:hypothetical protein
MVSLKKCAKSAKSAKSRLSCAGLPIIGALLHDFDRQNVTLLMASEQVGCLCLSPAQSGDKRDDIFVHALRIGDRPVCHPASVPSGLGPVTGGVVFSKLSKLLNQEDALSVPCLYGDFCPPQAPLAERKNTAERLNQSLLMSHYVCDHRVIVLTGTDAFPVVGGRCTGRARRCKAKQGRRGMTALTCEYLLPQ